jgi:hypothetical protein
VNCFNRICPQVSQWLLGLGGYATHSLSDVPCFDIELGNAGVHSRNQGENGESSWKTMMKKWYVRNCDVCTPNLLHEGSLITQLKSRIFWFLSVWFCQ